MGKKKQLSGTTDPKNSGMVQNLQRIIGDYHNGGDKWQNTDRLQLTIRGGLGEIIGASPRLRLIFTVSLFLPSLFVSIFHCQPRGYISKDGERRTMRGCES